jgi:hypothetical protein
MYYSLTQKLMALPDDMILFPGHNYAPLKYASMGEQKKTNPYLKFSSLKQFWRRWVIANGGPLARIASFRVIEPTATGVSMRYTEQEWRL